MGIKLFETRSWRPAEDRVGERIAIHAGTRHRIAHDVPSGTQERIWQMGITIDDLPRGAVLGTAMLTSLWPTEYVTEHAEQFGLVEGSLEWSLGDFSPGRYAWEFRLVEVFPEPIAARGYQKLWEWQPE